MPKTIDILIINGKILASPGTSGIIDSGFVAIAGSRITSSGPMNQAPAQETASQVINAAGCLVMPGLINSHCHAAMTLFRGLADDLPLMSWLNEYIFPAEASQVNPEMVYWCSKLAAAEMLLSGTTTVADSYFHEDQASQAFVDAGIRAVAAQGVIDFPAPGVPDPTKNIQAAESFIHNWQGKNPLLTPAVFCHSPYTCRAETLKQAKAMSLAQKAPFFIHLAETRDEIAQLHHRGGATPVRYLQELAILDPMTICVHAVWIDPQEITLLAETGTRIVHCPESNMKLAAGVAPVPAMLARNLCIGLGTDGCASNNDLDLFREMDSCAKLHKIHHMDPTVLPAKKVLQMAVGNGARLLGMEDILGSIIPGKLADIIIIDLRQPHLTPFYSEDILVYSARGSDVKTVIINGKIVVKDRVIVSFDLEETISQVIGLSRQQETFPRRAEV